MNDGLVIMDAGFIYLLSDIRIIEERIYSYLLFPNGLDKEQLYLAFENSTEVALPGWMNFDII